MRPLPHILSMWVSVGHADLVMKRTSPFLASQILDLFSAKSRFAASGTPPNAADGQTQELSMLSVSRPSPRCPGSVEPTTTHQRAARLMAISPGALQRLAIRLGQRASVFPWLRCPESVLLFRVLPARTSRRSDTGAFDAAR